MPDPFAPAARVVDEAIAARAFPGASAEVGTSAGAIWRYAAGALTYDAPAAVTRDTVYDLASLTKIICTATLAMRGLDAGRLALEAPVQQYLEDWRGADRETVTIRDLLAHSSGLTAYLPLYRSYSGRREFERAICELPLEYPPRTRAIYSDLGFILAGFVLEDIAAPAGEALTSAASASAAAALAEQFNRLATTLTDEPLAFRPPREWHDRTAPTEVDSWRGRLLAGEVHDENTWALGGAAGHAGLFGTAAGVGDFGRRVLHTIAGSGLLARPETMRAFIAPSTVPGSSRALAWDTMRPTSSCGTRLSPSSIGHTGFTGTSLWIDHERDFYVVLLTNRVHPTRENNAIREVRPRFHDAVATAMRG